MKNAQDHAVTSLPFNLSTEIKDGSALAGDEFNDEQLLKWFAEEREAFYDVNEGNSETDPWYAYMRLVNERLGFSRIRWPRSGQRSILILGPGSGIEIARFTAENPDWRICFLEASENFKAELKSKYPQSQVINATISGDISVEQGSQDVVCAFSVLHHLPRVSHVIRETFRVLKPGGLLLVREPCSSMGDWRFPRSATPNERGISRAFLVQTACRVGFTVEAKPIPILFSPLNSLFAWLGCRWLMTPFLFYPFYWFDRVISWLVSFNDYYWRDARYKKFGPSAYFYIFRKPRLG